MSDLLRRYFETHGGVGFPLLRLRRYVESHGFPGPEEVPELAERLSLPAAAVRSAASFYAALEEPPEVFRVCRGTSCNLAGAERLQAALHGETETAPVYCLGFCDRSPAVLTPEGEVILGEAARRLPEIPWKGNHPPPPDVRCAAPEAIVTRHLSPAAPAVELEDARRAGVYTALAQALGGSPEAVLEALERSGERGRGGAGFPAGVKWRRCAQAPGEEKVVIANGDEGDPGSYVDRVLMEHDPHSVLEGMLLAGFAVGASRGIVFVRGEYPQAVERMEAAVEEARKAKLLGPAVVGRGFAFDVTVFTGQGSYVCGEETALLNALEGFRGEVRLRPPYPTESGLHGHPTVVHNVETLVNVPWIVERGGEAYRALGTGASSGTKALCLNHGFARPGIVEVELGISLRRVMEELGGGGREGRKIEAVLLGGPMGSLLTPDQWDLPVCYGAMEERGVRLGHGGLVALLEGTDYRALLAQLLEFMRRESCGKCVPCRLGSQRAHELARDGDGDGRLDAGRRPDLGRLFTVMEEASLCAFGQLMPGPMRTLVERFGERIFARREEGG